MKARVFNLHNKEAEWQEWLDWPPGAGEIVVYDPDETYEYARIKIGDGITPLKDLPFFIDSAVETILQNISYVECIDSGRIPKYSK